MIAQVLGGIGIFLIGMILMTDGLKSLGGDALRRALTRFTGGTVQSIISGFAVTSLVQASSATILATIGFVSAGLITFTQAIAIVFGANLGTTTIGWLVSLLGFKFHVELIAMPMRASARYDAACAAERPLREWSLPDLASCSSALPRCNRG